MTHFNAIPLAEEHPPQTAAAAVMAASGKTFFQAARLLPRNVRDRVVALYAFCRYVDDLADESTQSLAVRSEQLHALQQALLNGQNEEPTGALTMLARSRNLSPSGRWAAAVRVGAARDDLEQKQPETQAELVSYAFGVAGTVGLMMADVLGAQNQGARAAVELGIAMQLSNIARDVAQDLSSGRVYLPASWISGTEVARALTHNDDDARQRLRASTQRLLRLADDFYDDAFSGFWTLPLRVRWSILAAALCYREIGIYVGKDIDASWHRRTVVPRWRKLTLIAIAAMRLLLPKYWRTKAADSSRPETDLLNDRPMGPVLRR